MSDIIVRFASNGHQRFEEGKPVMGYQTCGRLITIERNTSGCSGYILKQGDGFIVRIHNLDVNKPNMSPKPMRLISCSDEKIELRGYEVQAMTPFGWDSFDLSEYGITLITEGTTLKLCILHMYDRKVDIEYYIKDGSFPKINISLFKEL